MIKLNHILFLLCFFILAACSILSSDDKKPQKQENKSLNWQAAKKNCRSNTIIWSDNNNKLSFFLNTSEFGEQILQIQLNKLNLLNFHHSNGGKITTPFVVKNLGEVFVCFFEVYDGSGAHSTQHIYHINTKQNKLTPIDIEDITTIIHKVNSTDSLYTKKGFLYKNGNFDTSCFTENSTLPFSLILFNKYKPNMNNGLEGFGILNGIFVFKKQDNHFVFSAEEIKFTQIK